MQKSLLITLELLAIIVSGCGPEPAASSLRAPSYPLVTIDPYTSAWSPSDELYASTVEHWTGHQFPLLGVITVDGKDYRFLGKEKESDYRAIAPAAREHPWSGQYSLDKGRTWIDGQGGFGPEGRKPMTATWLYSESIYARRTVTLPGDCSGKELYLQVTSKGSAEFRVNGTIVAQTEKNEEMAWHRIPQEAIMSAKDGRLVLEGRVNSPEGKAVIDMGVYEKRTYRERFPDTAVQTSAQVLPMNTSYSFACGPVTLRLDFTAPLFLDNPELLSRPVNYISYKILSSDGVRHDVKLNFEAGREWVLDYATDENAKAETFSGNSLVYARSGCTDQNVLWKYGDNVRIDWGWLYLAADKENYRAGADKEGNISLSGNFGGIIKEEGKILIGYDDVRSIKYFGEELRPWWNADGNRTIEDEFEAADREYEVLYRKSKEFDARLMEDARAAGGQKYAELCALAYRQSISAHKLVRSPEGDILWLSKENNSNGSIGTVDVTYPSTPLYFIFNPELVKGMMNPIFHYSESGKWNKPFPAHDVGRYPVACGMLYGADMPIEEAGNMLILSAALCHYGSDLEYIHKHWETLTIWTDYLTKFGLDPENQLCTDDFAGHLAHNVNLSAKAILGTASYGYLAGKLGDEETAGKYMAKAREMAKEWVRMAEEDDHFRLTFDKPDSWSQKYNLVWDKLLGFNLFPDSVMEKEIAYYLTRQNRYGLPLDIRSAYTKTDWILWTASMAKDRKDFDALVNPVWDFYNETTDRVPMSDWIWSDKPEHIQFKARSVVGGLFIELLENKSK